jgi:hypothetical protein
MVDRHITHILMHMVAVWFSGAILQRNCNVYRLQAFWLYHKSKCAWPELMQGARFPFAGVTKLFAAGPQIISLYVYMLMNKAYRVQCLWLWLMPSTSQSTALMCLLRNSCSTSLPLTKAIKANAMGLGHQSLGFRWVEQQQQSEIQTVHTESRPHVFAQV